jgi:hypothetical protein
VPCICRILLTVYNKLYFSQDHHSIVLTGEFRKSLAVFFPEMTEGPPPSEATSSKASVISNLKNTTTSYAQYNPQPAAGSTSVLPTATAGLYQPYPQISNPYAAHYGPHAYYYPQYQSQPASYISQPPTPTSTSSSFNLKPMPKAPSPTPSPPLPDLETYKHWDLVIRAFFIKTGLTQTLKGFEDDMLVFNPEWERLKIPLAMEEMIKGLTVGFFLVFNF